MLNLFLVIFRYKKSIKFIKIKNKNIEFKEFYKYGLPYIIGLGGAWILNQSDKMIVENYFDANVLGGYALAYQIGITIRTFNSAIINVVYPNLYESFKMHNYLKIQIQYFFIFLTVGVIAFIALVIFLEYFFLKIYGYKYEPYMIIVIFTGYFFSIRRII